MYTLAIDIGGTFTKLMVLENRIEVKFYSIPTRAREGVEYLKADIFTEIRKNLVAYPLEAVGIATAGIVDDKTYEIIEVGAAFKNYAGFNWAAEIKKEFGLKAVVINDVKAASLGEYYFGAGKGYEDIYMLAIGTGIGGTYIQEGKIFTGHFGLAGEVGYVPKGASNIGVLASTAGLVSKSKKFKSGREIFAGLKDGDEEAKELVSYMAASLAELIGAIILMLDPELVILGGAVAEQEETLLSPIREILKREIPASIYKNTKLKTAALGNRAACFGAGFLAEGREINV